MKVYFGLFVLLASAALSTAVENEADKVKQNFNALLDEMNNFLVKIRSGLLADKRYKEMPSVELDRFALTVPGRQAVLHTVNFLYKNTQYWGNNTDTVKQLSVKISDTPDYVLSVFERLSENLLKVENGTGKEHKRKDNALAKVFGLAVRKEVTPSVQKFYELLEKYHDYVNPTKNGKSVNVVRAAGNFLELLKPDRNATYAARNVTNVVYQLSKNLVRISGGLLKDRRFFEVPAVELERFTLTVPTLSSLLQSVYFTFQHKKVWLTKANADLFVVKNANDSKRVLKLTDDLKVVLTQIQNATQKKDNVANALSKVLQYSLETAIKPSLVSYYELAEKYKRYLTPPKQDQLLSAFKFEKSEESSDSSKYFEQLFDQLNDSLELVRQGLFESKNFRDMGRVDFNKLMLSGVARSNLRNAVQFAVKYEKYWKNKTDDEELTQKLKNLDESSDESVILSVLDSFANIFDVTAKALLEDNKLVESLKSRVYENIVRKEVRPVVKSSLKLIEKYVHLLEKAVEENTNAPEEPQTNVPEEQATPEVFLNTESQGNDA